MTDIIDDIIDEPQVLILVNGERVPTVASLVISDNSEASAQAILFEAAQYAALVEVDGAHATFMRNLTGNATIEERDTWQSKELAARALLAGDATEAQAEMLVIEAGYVGTDAATLAATVVTKADQFKKLTGLAAGVRGKARAAIKAATTPELLKAATNQAQSDVAAALQLLQNG